MAASPTAPAASSAGQSAGAQPADRERPAPAIAAASAARPSSRAAACPDGFDARGADGAGEQRVDRPGRARSRRAVVHGAR